MLCSAPKHIQLIRAVPRDMRLTTEACSLEWENPVYALWRIRQGLTLSRKPRWHGVEAYVDLGRDGSLRGLGDAPMFDELGMEGAGDHGRKGCDGGDDAVNETLFEFWEICFEVEVDTRTNAVTMATRLCLAGQ